MLNTLLTKFGVTVYVDGSYHWVGVLAYNTERAALAAEAAIVDILTPRGHVFEDVPTAVDVTELIPGLDY